MAPSLLPFGQLSRLPSALVRGSTLRQTELMDPSLSQCSDWDLWVQIAAVAGLHILPEPFTVMRVHRHGRNLSTPTVASSNRSHREAIEILRRYGRSPILGQIDCIFADELEPAIAADASSDLSALVRLGLMATSSRHRHHRLVGIEFLSLALRRTDLEGGLSQQTRARAAHRLFLVSGQLDAHISQSKPTEPDWVDFAAQIYWRFESGCFSEEQSIQVSCSISSSPVHLSINIPPPGERLAAIRFDLANRPVRLLLRELTLSNAQEQVLWRGPSTWEGGFEAVAMSCHPPASGTGIVVETLDNDPQWILPLSQTICDGLTGGGTLDMVLQLA